MVWCADGAKYALAVGAAAATALVLTHVGAVRTLTGVGLGKISYIVTSTAGSLLPLRYCLPP